MKHRFTPTTFFIWGGLLIWAADFLFVYVFAALACARQFTDVRVAGFAIVPLATTLASLLALAATAVLMGFALLRARAADDADEHSRFIQFLAIALCALGMVATAWTALPPLLLNADSLSCTG